MNATQRTMKPQYEIRVYVDGSGSRYRQATEYRVGLSKEQVIAIFHRLNNEGRQPVIIDSEGAECYPGKPDETGAPTLYSLGASD